MTLEDEYGTINIIIPKSVFETYRPIALRHPLLEIEGCIEFRDDVCQFQTEKVFALQVSETGFLEASRDFY